MASARQKAVPETEPVEISDATWLRNRRIHEFMEKRGLTFAEAVVASSSDRCEHCQCNLGGVAVWHDDACPEAMWCDDCGTRNDINRGLPQDEWTTDAHVSYCKYVVRCADCGAREFSNTAKRTEEHEDSCHKVPKCPGNGCGVRLDTTYSPHAPSCDRGSGSRIKAARS